MLLRLTIQFESLFNILKTTTGELNNKFPLLYNIKVSDEI